MIRMNERTESHSRFDSLPCPPSLPSDARSRGRNGRGLRLSWRGLLRRARLFRIGVRCLGLLGGRGRRRLPAAPDPDEDHDGGDDDRAGNAEGSQQWAAGAPSLERGPALAASCAAFGSCGPASGAADRARELRRLALGRRRLADDLLLAAGGALPLEAIRADQRRTARHTGGLFRCHARSPGRRTSAAPAILIIRGCRGTVNTKRRLAPTRYLA